MSSAHRFETRTSLIVSLSNSSNPEEVWPDFVDKYGPLLYQWCLRWGAMPQDAEDIVQQSLLSVFLNIACFEKGGPGTFRAWMRRIARNVWLKIAQKSMRNSTPGDAQVQNLVELRQLRTGQAREDLLRRFDALAVQEIRELVDSIVRNRVRPSTWQAYELSAREGLPGREIADRIGVSADSVHLSCFRVRRMILQDLERVDPSLIHESGVRSLSRDQ